MTKHIIAISGGGFSTHKHAYIDDYILRIRRSERKLRIGFIATASNDAAGYIEKFYEAFQAEEPSHFTIHDLQTGTIKQAIDALDIIYVGGGDTAFLLKTWRNTGFHHVLRNAYEKGVVLAGISAGAMCWFETCFVERADSQYEAVEGLGLLKGSFCPHYNDDARRAAFDEWAAHETIPLYTVNDNETLHFQNEHVVAKITT